MSENKSRTEDQKINLALRTFEIKEEIERGFWAEGRGNVAGAFSVVARMLAEQEARILALEEKSLVDELVRLGLLVSRNRVD